MDSHNTTTSSTIRTDYGSATLKISIDNSGTPVNEADEDTTQTATASSSFGYQSLPHSTSTNLYAKSTLKSRFGRMTVDPSSHHLTESRQLIQRVEYFFNVLNQICIGFVTIYMSWLCLRTGLAGTALHAWLVTIGFVFLMSEAIMCHYNHNVLTFNYRRTTKTTLHWILQALGGGCGIAGVLIKCIQKGFLLSSTHGKLGFAAFILCSTSMLSGLTALYSMRFKRFLSPLLNKTFHNILGLATFAVALSAQFYGYNTGFYSRKTPSHDFTILMQTLTLMALVLSSWGALKSLYQKFWNVVRHFH